VIEMDAQELLLRERVHHAYDALDVRAPSTVGVLRRVQSRVERRGQLRQRAWIGGALLAAAALGAVSVVGIQLVPRGARVQPSPNTAARPFGAQGTYGDGGPGYSSTGDTNGNSVGAAQPFLAPCAAHDLAVAVSTDHSVYGMSDVVTVAASITNRGHVTCAQPGWSSVSVQDQQGTLWRLCPETDWPPPSPTAVRPARPLPMANGSMFPSRPGSSYAIVTDGFTPGQSESVVCTWHTQYRRLNQGTYSASATWDGVSATTSFTLLQLQPSSTPTPSPQPSPTASPLLPKLP